MESTNPDPTPEPQEEDLWVRTQPTPDGDAYVIAISLGPDVEFTLTPDEAVTYATHVIGVCARAQYDAAVAAHMEALGLDGPTVGQSALELRCARPPLGPAAWPWPLGFRGIVSHRTRGPIVNLVVDDRPVAQVDAAAVMNHALGVLEMAHVAGLDQVYYRWLTNTIGTTDAKARRAVMALSEHRHDPK